MRILKTRLAGIDLIPARIFLKNKLTNNRAPTLVPIKTRNGVLSDGGVIETATSRSASGTNSLDGKIIAKVRTIDDKGPENRRCFHHRETQNTIRDDRSVSFPNIIVAMRIGGITRDRTNSLKSSGHLI